MKYTALFFLSLVIASGFPGMDTLLNYIRHRQSITGTSEMIGDLPDGATTPVGRQVRECIAGVGSCENLEEKSYNHPGDLGTALCQADTCCVWDFVQEELVELFRNENGTCNNLARASVRLGFYDAGAWSKSSGAGDADGSLLLSSDEINRPENNGLQKI